MVGGEGGGAVSQKVSWNERKRGGSVGGAKNFVELSLYCNRNKIAIREKRGGTYIFDTVIGVVSCNDPTIISKKLDI